MLVDDFDRRYWKIQSTMFVVMVSIWLTSTIVAFLHVVLAQSAPLSAIEFSLIIFILIIKLIAFAIGTTSPALFLHMIEASPRAMRHLQSFRLIIKLMHHCISQVAETVVRARLWLTGKRLFLSGTYSLANLFSVTAVPFRLYPLSCTLLE